MNNELGQMEVSAAEKVSYGALGFGRKLSGQMISIFIMSFYTDVFGIPLQSITVMLFVIAIWEGCSKQLVGFLMGKIQPRSGTYRPYLLWMNAPFLFFSAAMFFVPDLSVQYKILYAYVTYFIWALVNNTLSVAHNALLPMISADPSERTWLNSLKLIFSVLATMIVSMFTLDLVGAIGGGNPQKGFALTALGMAAINVPIQYFGYRNIKERYAAAVTNKISVKTAVRSLADKRLILFLLTYGTFWICCTMKNQSAIYYIRYVLERPEYISVFLTVGTAASFATHFFVRRIVSAIRIETAIAAGLAGIVPGVLIMYAAGSNMPLLVLGNIVFGVMSAMPANLVYIVLAEYVDENNKRYQANFSSWLYSCMDNFGIIGIGIGGAAFSRLLDIFGYTPNVPQASPALFGIKLGFSGGTVIAALAALILMVFHIYARNTSGRQARHG